MAADTKQLIADTLFEILERQKIDAVTVKSLVEACGISRQTFYYHFRDIMEGVEWAAAQTLQETVDASMKAATKALDSIIREAGEESTPKGAPAPEAGKGAHPAGATTIEILL